MGCAGGPFCRISCSNASTRVSIFSSSSCSITFTLPPMASESIAARFASSMLSTFSQGSLPWRPILSTTCSGWSMQPVRNLHMLSTCVAVCPRFAMISRITCMRSACVGSDKAPVRLVFGGVGRSKRVGWSCKVRAPLRRLGRLLHLLHLHVADFFDRGAWHVWLSSSSSSFLFLHLSATGGRFAGGGDSAAPFRRWVGDNAKLSVS